MKNKSLDQTPLAAPSKKWLAAQQEHSRQTPPGTHAAPSFDRPVVVSSADWLAARVELLQQEKEFTRQRDSLAARQRALPWLKLEKSYTFDAPRGRVSLADLFEGRSQLIVQHFMFGPGWEEGCKSCSFMMDHLSSIVVHLKARDVSFAAVSHAPLAEIQPFQRRMGWDITWVSAHGTDFNTDFQVSFKPEEVSHTKVVYNFTRQDVPNSELPGISVYARDASGSIYRTYSTYGRGVEVAMTTYDLLDLVPKGRNEEGLEYGMAWLRHHDRYEQTADVLAAR
jgi:predicted dithiol-disulfide oxidoreductase (DUF899 family)